METLLKWLNQEIGRQKRLAATLGITPAALSQWSRVPAERVLDVEKATGISRYTLRPDIFGAKPREKK